jgi:hypothetical protein
MREAMYLQSQTLKKFIRESLVTEKPVRLSVLVVLPLAPCGVPGFLRGR